MGMTDEHCFQRQRAFASLRAKCVLFSITGSSEEASLNSLYVCMQLKSRKQLISGASGPQGQKAKTQNMLYPFPLGFDLIRSGHLPGQKGLYLNADVSNPDPLWLFNTGYTLLVFPLLLWLPSTSLILP